ncbi:MAG: carbamoyltransferase [Deltaproteobacteria bacterium]|nr:carbamoyltransferase [Deltaproteobacteria bacterium]
MNRVLGINSVYHESSAALVVDGELLAAAEEERFSRKKHAKEARIDNPHDLPLKAIKYCLDSVGVGPDEIDAFCYSFNPHLRADQFQLDTEAHDGGWGSAEGEEVFRACLQKVPVVLSRFLGVDLQERFHWVTHHLAHAASAFFASRFPEAAVLVADGIAENASTMIAKASGTKITELEEIHYPHSLGFLWEKLSEFLGFTSRDASKVMGLAAYGDENGFSKTFDTLCWMDTDEFRVNRSLAQFRQPRFDKLASLLGPKRMHSEAMAHRHYNIASSLQRFTDQAILALARKAFDLFPQKNLCMAGGLALNCKTNQLVKDRGPFENLYIPPAPHDAGTAAGAALIINFKLDANSSGLGAVPPSPYLGPTFSNREIEEEVARLGLKADYTEEPWERAAALLAKDQIIGWFQGRMEFGPRGLGNRSILADPRTSEARERLNKKIKHRENFRPLAPSVLAEAADEWFSLGRCSESLAYMVFACPVRRDKVPIIPAVVHADLTARVQLIKYEDNPKFYKLIKAFRERTGVPMVLNTSFNIKEPIVCTPHDALETFKKSNLDALVIGNYVVDGRH